MANIRGDKDFITGNLHRHAPVWRLFYETLSKEDQQRPIVKRVMKVIGQGIRMDFVPPSHQTQRAHPKYRKNMDRMRKALTRQYGREKATHLITCKKPGRVHLPNMQSYHAHETWVVQELQENLLPNKVVVEWWWPNGEPPQCILPLGVDVRPDSNKKRLIWDAGYLNMFCRYVRFTMETLDQAVAYAEPGSFATTSDAKAGYHHLCFAPEFLRFTGIQIGDKVYVFAAMGFGWGPGPRIYTEITSVQFMIIRSMGTRMTMYIDDRIMLNGPRQREELKRDTLMVHLHETSLGWATSLKKLRAVPTQQPEFLGLIIHLQEPHPHFYVPPQKMESFVKLAQSMLGQPKHTPRQYAQLAGKLSSFRKAVLLAPLLCKEFWEEQTSVTDWDEPLPVPARIRHHLEFVLKYVPIYNGHRIWKAQRGLVMAGDASAWGFGAFVVSHDLRFEGSSGSDTGPNLHPRDLAEFSHAGQVFRTSFSSLQAQAAATNQYSSTLREVECLRDFLQAMLQHHPTTVTHRAVLYLTDSMNTATNVNRMKGGAGIFEVVKEIWFMAMHYDIDLQVTWLPRDTPVMQAADAQSKLLDPSSWSLSQWHTELVMHTMGRPDLDTFADEQNAKAQHFFSWALCPGTAGIDGFVQPWRGDGTGLPIRPLCWVNGPFQRMPDILRKVKEERADAIIIVPDWVEGWKAILTMLPIKHTLLLPKTDAVGAPRVLFHPGPRVPEKQRLRGYNRQPSYEVWAVLVLWPESHRLSYEPSPPSWLATSGRVSRLA
jgi:hypothetical protein